MAALKASVPLVLASVRTFELPAEGFRGSVHAEAILTRRTLTVVIRDESGDVARTQTLPSVLGDLQEHAEPTVSGQISGQPAREAGPDSQSERGSGA